MSQLDENIVLMCAMRYALGRKTYVVSCVTDELIKNWHHFKKGNQVGILKEIREAIEKDEAGMDMDIERWIAVVNHAISETKHAQNKNEYAKAALPPTRCRKTAAQDEFHAAKDGGSK